MTENERFSWAVKEMTEMGATESEKKLVQELLELYWKNENENVLDMFCQLAADKSLTRLTQAENDGTWLSARPGNMKVQDTVRVKMDAYRDKSRMHHNGRVGTVVGIRYGIVSVHYTDGPESEVPASFTQHRLQLLEKRY